MGCLRVRVDDRLLHSEVLFGELGTPYCEERQKVTFDHLMIASNLAWFDSIETDQVPIGVRVTLVKLDVVAQHVVANERTLLVVGTLTDLELVLESALVPSEIILANRASRNGTACLDETFYVDLAELNVLNSLIEQRKSVFAQRVPTSSPKKVDVVLLSKLNAAFDSAEKQPPPA